MEIKIKTSLLLVLIVLLSSGKVSCKEDTLNEKNMLIKSWVHSYEEDTDVQMVYRPIDAREFPPSRYRQVLIFDENNRCRYLVLAPDDGHYFEQGSWYYKETEKTIIIKNAQEEIKYSLKVVRLGSDILAVLK